MTGSASSSPTGHPLRTLFEPSSIVLIGASESSIWSQLVLRNYPTLDYAGRLFAVNKQAKPVHGIPGFASCADIGEPVDLAFLLLPQSAVLDGLRDAARAGVRNAVVLASGYNEVGAVGAAAQAELIATARSLGMRIWGPNTLGFLNISARAPVSAIEVITPILPPRIAILSQSGASASELYELAHGQNIGASFVAALGNQGDVSLSDVLDYLIDHQPTRAIAIFAEGISDPAGFAAAARRAREVGKPIVVLKIGRSELASAVAMAHTGSLIGDDRIFDAVCRRLGMIRVESTEDLINVTALLAATGPLESDGLGFVSISGGACTLAADAAAAHGVILPDYDADTLARLHGVLPDFASARNPLDATGAAVRDPALFERLVPIVAEAQGVGLLAINMTLPTRDKQGLPAALTAVGRALATVRRPAVMVTTCVKTLNDFTRAAVADNDLPHIISGIEPMMRAVARAVAWSSTSPAAAFDDHPGSTPTSARPRSEREVLAYLAEHGVPVIPNQLAASAAEAGAAARVLDGALVMKIASPDIAHKTEVGGVRLDLAPADAASAFDAMVGAVRVARPDAQIDGVIVSPMRTGPAVELIVGVTRDPLWGQMLTLGMGGVLVEVLNDAVIEPLPVDRAGVIAMLNRLRGFKLLQGYRGSEAADLDRVADAVVAIAAAAAELGPALASLEVNPLRVQGALVEALDGLALWSDPAVSPA